MAGAGGGGFMYAVAKKPGCRAEFEKLIAALPKLPDTPRDLSFHDVTVDDQGLAITIGSGGSD